MFSFCAYYYCCFALYKKIYLQVLILPLLHFFEHEDFVLYLEVNTAERVDTTTPNEAISVTKGISSNQYSKEQKNLRS